MKTPNFVLVLCLPLLLAGCSLTPAEGQFECQGDDDCPPGWVCNVNGDGLCYSDAGEFPSGDADADTDTDTDTDIDTDIDTDGPCPQPPYQCMNQNACVNNGGTVMGAYTCSNPAQICCDMP